MAEVGVGRRCPVVRVVFWLSTWSCCFEMLLATSSSARDRERVEPRSIAAL